MMPYQPYQSTWQNPFLPQYNQGQPVQPMIQPYQQPVNGITKVNGPQSAMQIQLPPNSTSQPLIDASFDGKKGMMYVVSTDGTGTKSLEWFDFTVHVEEQPVQIDGAQFVSRQEFDDFTKKVNAAIGAINGSNAAVPATVPAASTAVGAEGTNVPAALDAPRGHFGAGV
jgi:hypothetical protein